jgi:exonuclease III
MKYVSWNCRGLGNKLKEEALKDIIRMTMPEILLIQETKLEESDLLQASKTFWKKGQGKAVSARGASGGINTFWDNSKLDLIEEEESTHWIYSKLLHKESGHLISLFNLYVPVLFSEKRVCWDSLKSFLNLHNPENIIIAGDLNITLSSSEKKGGSPVRDPAREWVEDLIMDWDLEDIKPARGKYTWTNKRMGPGHIAARLDRFLVQSSFLTLGLAASSKILPNYTSDHKPILLDLFSEANLGPIPFQFSPIWIHQEGFQEIVPTLERACPRLPVLCVGRKVVNSQESLKKLGQNPHVSNFQEKRSRGSS